MPRSRQSRKSACPGRPSRDASWSNRPVCAPVQRCSTSEHRRASSRGSGTAAAASASRARHSAVSSAADEASPMPRGRSPLISRRAPGSSIPADDSSAATPRTNARQPLAGSTAPRVKRSLSPQIERSGVDHPGLGSLGHDGHAPLDRERQAEPEVVVGVLADQVDAAGAARRDPLGRHRTGVTPRPPPSRHGGGPRRAAPPERRAGPAGAGPSRSSPRAPARASPLREPWRSPPPAG